jgi:hypothetical protein
MAVPAPPIFVHSNWRTGGTALLAALRRHPALMVFIDPLNPGLGRPWSELSTLGPESWLSGHPREMGAYFTEYASLICDDHIRGWSDQYFWNYDLSADADDPGQEAYLRSLIHVAEAEGRTAVIKMEQSEGRVEWLRTRFPGSVHVGITRSWDGQFSSWATQLLLYGGDTFFAWAHHFVVRNPRLFGTHGLPAAFDIAQFSNLTEMFDAFHAVTSRVRADDCDVAFDVSPESAENPGNQVEHLRRAATSIDSRIWADALTYAHDTRPATTLLPRDAWRRIHAGHIRLMGERDAWRSAQQSAADAAENRRIALEREQADVARLTKLLQHESGHVARLQDELDRVHGTRSWRLIRALRDR